jgi:toxin-antitoxin system PIN domain toxin
VTTYLLDSSVWLAVSVSGHVHHSVARGWFGGVQSPDRILFCRSAQLSFLRLLTTSAFQAAHGDPALNNDQAWIVFDALVGDDRVVVEKDEPEGLESYWRQYAGRTSASPKVWMDAYLAAFAAAGGHRLVTLDKDFRQFDGLDLLLLTSDP